MTTDRYIIKWFSLNLLHLISFTLEIKGSNLPATLPNSCCFLKDRFWNWQARPLCVSLQIEAAKNSPTCLWPPISSKHPRLMAKFWDETDETYPFFLGGSDPWVFFWMEANFWNFSELPECSNLFNWIWLGMHGKKCETHDFFYQIESAKSYESCRCSGTPVFCLHVQLSSITRATRTTMYNPLANPVR